MKLTTKLLALLMALMMLASVAVLTSCDSGNTPGGADITTPVDTTPADTTPADTTPADTTPADTTPVVDIDLTPKDLVIVSDGKTSAQVVRREGLAADDAQVTYAGQLRDAVKAVSGATPKVATDWIRPGTDHDHDTVEILVGYTDYLESQSVLADVSYGEYVIKVVGNKLIIGGYSQSALAVACQYAKNLIRNNGTDGSLVIPADTYITDVIDNMLDSLPTYSGGGMQYVVPNGGNVQLVIIKDTTVDQYEDYLKALESAGFTQYTTNEISGNYFATYNSDKYTVNLGFYDYEDSVRLSIEPLADPVGLKKDNVYTKVTTSQITMLGLEFKANDGTTGSSGQSILIRLEDGRFIIVDGGYHINTGAKHGDLLVSALKEQSKDYLKPGEKITIAAWIITHTHADHWNMIRSQYSKFTGMNVEMLMVNLMSESEVDRAVASNSTDEQWTDRGDTGLATLTNVAKSLKSKLQFVHVGQTFYMADVKMDILYTHESYAPKVVNAFNTTSITTKFTFDSGDTFLMTGDNTGDGMQTMAKTFGDYLKCDILQVAHHGAGTWGNDAGIISAYKTIAPETLLWPTGAIPYPSNTAKSHNKVLFSSAEGGKNANFKESLIAGAEGEQVILPIPYTPGSAIEIRN